MKRIAAVLTLAGAVVGLALPATASAATPTPSGSVCVHLSFDVNGQAQTIDQCLPPAS